MTSIPTRQHSFPLDCDRTALIVIDMQNDFCHPDGFCGVQLQADLSAMRAIIPQVQAAIAWAKACNLLTIYTRESHKPDGSDITPSKQQRYINAGYPIGSVGKMGRFLIQGEAGTRLIDELHPQDTDWQIDKPAQSIFVGTDLGDRLQQRGISHLLFTGVTTECCVLASYRHASDLGFFCLLLEDCCAALNPAEHQAAIDVLLSENGAVGWVAPLAHLLAACANSDG
ncbi:MAG: isochorismatase family cysteine hydrolase [Thermosynechococcaceae cyanobacterium]